MKKISFQFHATHNDLKSFINGMIEMGYFVYGLILFPQFVVDELTGHLNGENINIYEMVIISEKAICVTDQYRDYIQSQENVLGITIGKENMKELFESSIWVFSSSEINLIWKKHITRIKRSMLKGAWVVNRNSGARKFYKDHMYTSDAQKSYKEGKIMRPIVGWNEFELTGE